MLDVRCFEFSNGVLAASALFHFSSLELVENVSGKKKQTKQVVFIGDRFYYYFLLVVPRLTTFSSFFPCSFEEGGGRAVCEVDGAVRNGTAGGWRLHHEDVHRNPCR